MRRKIPVAAAMVSSAAIVISLMACSALRSFNQADALDDPRNPGKSGWGDKNWSTVTTKHANYRSAIHVVAHKYPDWDTQFIQRVHLLAKVTVLLKMDEIIERARSGVHPSWASKGQLSFSASTVRSHLDRLFGAYDAGVGTFVYFDKPKPNRLGSAYVGSLLRKQDEVGSGAYGAGKGWFNVNGMFINVLEGYWNVDPADRYGRLDMSRRTREGRESEATYAGAIVHELLHTIGGDLYFHPTIGTGEPYGQKTLIYQLGFAVEEEALKLLDSHNWFLQGDIVRLWQARSIEELAREIDPALYGRSVGSSKQRIAYCRPLGDLTDASAVLEQ